ncbi:hypothetical protein C8J56DRAFT_419922 [Mycena floridula]|nr:hypothetical protein C8J56DRAFT_419922 [Mycena floridula]
MFALRATVLLFLPLFFNYAVAIGQQNCVSFKSSSSSFPVVSNGQAAPVFISSDDWPGVQRAASDFVSDIQKVTNVKSTLSNVTSSSSSLKSTRPIIIGTLGKSSLIDQVVNNTGLDVSGIQGRWESFIRKEVANPLPGVASAYLMIGSDKRGTIYSLYDLSEQFGVSPWYWWADVPVTTNAQLFTSECSHGPPTVQFRGIFLNDEQPSLQNWAMEKFTNGTGAALTGSPFNHLFYTKLFELILRVKGNYLWPAIWSSAFAIDDPMNQFLADYYGVAMGTSHQEPMMRSTPIEFDLFETGPWAYSLNNATIYNYWLNGTIRAKPFESVYTMGMRGSGDIPLAEGQNIDLLTKIISDQRQILTDVYNGTDITTIPQIWALYKEVEGYYDDGMTVPEDITLLWTDDNWGNIRRFPVESERNRSGGAGIYYHVDYVGAPRDFKWITSSQISRMHEQLSIGVEKNATRLWILNVGDLKPYERETEFFLTYAWNSSLYDKDNLDSYVVGWAQREFDLSLSDADVVSNIIANVTRWNMRRKPELLNSTTYSLINYREAESVQAGWADTLAASTKIYNSLSKDMQPAFFQMVQHPVTASANLGNMMIAAGMNNVRASQARVSANALADQVVQLFEKDFDIQTDYHTILDGKWDHMMEQTHIGYYYWQQPMADTMPMITRVQSRKQALAGIMRIVVEGNQGAWPGDNPFQCANGYNCGPPTMTLDSFDNFQSRFIDVGAAGPQAFTFTVSTNVSWLTLSATKGSISPTTQEQRLFASVPDWSKLEPGANYAGINFTATATGAGVAQQLVKVLTVPAIFIAQNTKPSLPSSFKGFVETGGVVSMEAVHASRNTSVAGVSWTVLPGLGRTLSAITPWPRTGPGEGNFSVGQGPSVEYDFFTFSDSNASVTTLLSVSLNSLGLDRPLGFAVQLDSLDVQSSYFMPFAVPGSLPDIWNDFASNSIIPVTMKWTNISAGAHTLKIFMIEPTVVVQKIFIDTGGLQDSYLGPPESIIV